MVNLKDLNIIGLTGMSGSGKSTAAAVFAEHGFRVIDCDKTAKNVIAKPPCSEAVREAFPKAFSENEFDKVKMARIVFSDAEKLKCYEKIVFPFIIFNINEIIFERTSEGERNFLLDASTLFQSKADDLCRKIIAVVADENICAERIIHRDNISKKAALMRLSAGLRADFYKEKADFFIENNGSKLDLEKKVIEVISENK